MASMGGIGLFRQGWKWVQSRKQAFVFVRVAASWAGEKLVLLVDRHWPLVYSWCTVAGRFLFRLILQWRDCFVGGLRSLFTLGSAALFLVLWSCFLCLTSTTSLVYMLLSLVAAAAVIHYLGFTPGLLIVGLYGILIMWIYGYFWITAMLFIGGGYMFSLNHARFLILMATAYAVYYINARVGLHGVFLSLSLSFISNDILNKLLQGYDGTDEGIHEEQKEPEPFMEDFSVDSEDSPPKEAEEVTSYMSPCTTSKASHLPSTHKDASSSKVVMVESTSLVEMKRIMNSTNHYEVLGFLKSKTVDPKIMKKEYHKKVLLVHPDKNLGSPLACESFKKLQCAYEVLSDLTKKKNYDEQLRREESGRVCQRSSVTSQQGGVEYRSEESRRIECTKCGNSHIWICTNRSKGRARWCQSCSQYHQAKDGDGWVESGCSPVVTTPRKVEIPQAFVCAESKIFDVSEWAICQGMACKPNTHGPSFHVNMVGLDGTGLRSNPSRYPWGLDAEMIVEDDEFELWLQQALASGIFSESPKRRKSWPFKINHKSMKPWRKSP
ncbi:uncharacterized protein LOC135641318 [Musa acuminata AAA Group]|uniref:(wild Malaysian banana) hypothetical protein n=1 Tax=Musa acuminata subsp. malaccensis TaxID=214687 RepID=A0A804JN27_MUSAM|nr:PREDICTED: uncharacterized protein LOC103989563 [Musa acuminata subsp. malaccensis]CAG1848127.1 unnamed protein product [Musa acuminata subsp. malaccensis]